jgi:hypothetical protein
MNRHPVPAPSGITPRRLARLITDMTGDAEGPYMKAIMELGKAYGWLSMHVARSLVNRGGQKHWVTNTIGTPGPPDLWMVNPRLGALLVLETKSRRGKATAEQLAWIAALQTVTTVEAYVVGPRDAHDVLAILAGIETEEDT